MGEREGRRGAEGGGEGRKCSTDVELRAKSGTNTGSSLSCTPRAGSTHRDTAGAPFHYRTSIPVFG